MIGAEVPRVYCGSFHEGPLLREEFSSLFSKDHDALMKHLSELPKLCGMRKINEMVKRIRLNIANYCLVTYLKSQMPLLWGHEKKQKYLLDNLDEVYRNVAYQYNLSLSDFPNQSEFRGKLQKTVFSEFPSPNRATLQVLSEMLSVDIPQIFKSIAGVTSASEREKQGNDDDDEGDQNLKAMMNFDLNSPQLKQNNHTASVISAVFFLLFVIAVAFALQGGYLSKWLSLAEAVIANMKNTKANEPSL